MGKMTIAFDASRATVPQGGGTEYYAAELLLSLAKIDRKHQYLLYSPHQPFNNLKNLPSNFLWKITPPPRRFWSQTNLCRELFHSPPDVFFTPAHITPLFLPRKTRMITVVHDLSFIHFPYLFNQAALLYHWLSLRIALKKSTAVIVPSQYTKEDIIKRFSLTKDKIKVIYHGYRQEIYSPVQKITKNKPYIFYVGRLEKKKNTIGMLEAYRLLRQGEDISHCFYLAGKPGYGYDKIRKKIKELPKDIRKDIVELGYVPEDKLSDLMRQADIFLFTTFFEGFGFPIIEAMASGTPVITSSLTSMPEIAGDAALIVNPYKPQEISTALSKIIRDKKLKERLIKKGLIRASLFSWIKTAEQTLRVIEEVGNE